MNREIDEYNQESFESITSNIGSPQKRTKWLIINTIDEFNQLLKNHPYLFEQQSFPIRYQRVVKYFRFKKILSESDRVSLAEAARKVAIPQTTAHYWKQGNLPILMKVLLDNERVLRHKESLMTPEYKSHLVPSYEVYNSFKTLSLNDECIERLCIILESIANASQNQLCVIELKPYNKKHQKAMQRIANYIVKKLNLVEKELENHSIHGNNLRVGVVDDKLFLWNQKERKKHFALLADELFYFDKSVRTDLIGRTQQHLGGYGAVKLSLLVRQLTGYTFKKKFPINSINADLKHEKHYLSGRTLHFFLDVLNLDIDQLIQHVIRIGRGNQIRKPLILKNNDFLELMTRLFAIIGSDGHIQRKLDRVQYSEWNDQRRTRVIQLLKRLGDIEIKLNQSDDGKITRIYLPPVLGRILLKLGMPAGDKVLSGYNLPDFILEGTFASRCGYFEEVLPEEAHFSIRKTGAAYVILGRRGILQDPSKSEEYNLQSKITQNHLSIIRYHGRKQLKSYGMAEVIEKSVVLSRRKLRALREKTEQAEEANKLLKIINDNRPLLLVDERKLLRSIGINTAINWREITLYESGRVSVLWQIRTQSQYDTALWGILAPPNDVVKFIKFQAWLEEKKSLVQQIQSDTPSYRF